MDKNLIEKYKQELLAMHRASLNQRPNTGFQGSSQRRQAPDAPRQIQSFPETGSYRPPERAEISNFMPTEEPDIPQNPPIPGVNVRETETNPSGRVQGGRTDASPEMRSETVPSENESGKLVVYTTTVRNLYPVPNAKVTVFTGPYDSMQVVADETSDESGKTAPITLYAPERSSSLNPESSMADYAEYNLLVQADGYLDNLHLSIPIFSGITSFQRSNLLSRETAGPQAGPRVFDHSKKYDL